MTLDAAFLPTAEGSPRKLGQLRALITLLHESGAMVALEGLAQPEALRWALDTPVDLVSGPAVWPWAPPAPTAMGNTLAGPAALPAFEQALAALRTSEPLETACATLLYEAGVLRCYVLNDKGEQLTENLSPAGTRSDPRYWPLAQAERASWAHRPYFRQALAHPGALLVSDPYFSLPDGGPCQTPVGEFSVRWTAPSAVLRPGAAPAAERASALGAKHAFRAGLGVLKEGVVAVVSGFHEARHGAAIETPALEFVGHDTALLRLSAKRISQLDFPVFTGLQCSR